MFKRILTAVVLMPLVFLGTTRLNNDYFVIVLALIVVLSAWEYCQLIQIKRPQIKAVYSLVVVFVGIAAWYCKVDLIPILIISSVWWVGNILWVVLYPKYPCFWYSSWGIRLANGLLIFVPMLLALTALQKQDPEITFLLLVLTWSADSGALVTGKTLGKHKLCPQVSPRKTIEGAVGGILTTIIVMVTYVGFMNEILTVNQYLIFGVLAFLTAVYSIVGDLFESLYKRISNTKDSGNLLPGHGGIFDRIDSLTAAAPIFYLFYNAII